MLPPNSVGATKEWRELNLQLMNSVLPGTNSVLAGSLYTKAVQPH